jgi:hypothetical protein
MRRLVTIAIASVAIAGGLAATSVGAAYADPPCTVDHQPSVDNPQNGVYTVDLMTQVTCFGHNVQVG